MLISLFQWHSSYSATYFLLMKDLHLHLYLKVNEKTCKNIHCYIAQIDTFVRIMIFLTITADNKFFDPKEKNCRAGKLYKSTRFIL